MAVAEGPYPWSEAHPEDPLAELLIETLAGLAPDVAAPFLHRFFKALVHVELSEQQCQKFWDEVVERRRALVEELKVPVSLRMVVLDVLTRANVIRRPVLVESEDLKRLQINAATDDLTGLYNRRLFHENFAKELNRAKRYNAHLSVVLLDLHRFKEVNDRHGHLMGDRVLKSAAETLLKSIRSSDTAFRIGGDEFGLLLPEADAEQAGILARRVRSNFEGAVQPLELEVPVSFDFGIATFPEVGQTEEALLQHADTRLYQLKEAVRTGVGVPAELATPGVPEAPRDKRRHERISLRETSSFALLLPPAPEVKLPVLDLSYGGLALLVGGDIELPATFHAELRVPILPVARVFLRCIYHVPDGENQFRVGCSFSEAAAKQT
jgi:diguanylate cyclase (GGDEF)-like protein